MPMGKLYKSRKRKVKAKAVAVKVVNQPRSYKSTSVEIGKPILPKTFRTTLRYVDSQIINNSVAGTTNGIIYRANSIFDPEFAVGGQQPRGTDQFQPLYGNFLVLNCTLTVHISNTNNTTMAMGGLAMSTGPTALGKIDWLEGRYSKWKLNPPSHNGSQPLSMRKKMNISKFLGVKNIQSNTALRGTLTGAGTGTNPSIEAFFQVLIAAQDDGLSVGNQTVTAVLDYDVVFSEPITPPQS